MKKGKKPKFFAVDFFCGAGGSTRGLIDAGGYVIAGIDKDKSCQTTYTKNNLNKSLDKNPSRFLNYDIFPKTDQYPQGERTKLLKELQNFIGNYRNQAPELPLLFTICAPCQPFTRLSRKALTKQKKLHWKRDKNLILETVKFVRKFKPELILSENVPNINKPKYGGMWEEFISKLKKSGYVVGAKVVCASRFGIPQFRERSILIAVRKDMVLEERLNGLRKKELLVPERDPDATICTVEEALHHLPKIKAGKKHERIPNHCSSFLSDLNMKRIKSAKPGENNMYLMNTKFGDLSLACHKRAYKKNKRRYFADVYTRMHPNKPSPTITTKCFSISNGRFGHYDRSQARAISIREAATLQSFPNNFIFYPTDELISPARMIGNAVPPKLSEFFAHYLLNSIDSRA